MNPVKICSTCNRERDCTLHMFGRGFPPDKAERWLRKSCPKDGVVCKIAYRAGLIVGSRPCGQLETK